MKKYPFKKIKFTVFIFGQSLNSIRVLENVRRFCENFFESSYEIKIIDLSKEPEKAVEHNVLAVPTTMVDIDGQKKKLIGTLHDMDKLAEFLTMGTG
jgi:circadian clock protein KaiB